MDRIFSIEFSKFFTGERIAAILISAGIILLGLLALKIISTIVIRLMKKRITPQTSMIIRKIIFYSGVTLIVLNVLHRLGIDLSPLLGAAGIAGIAIGFASQTSVSNLISGLFLISEKSFAVGDVISVGTTTGVILSIDLLSVKIRTFDNRFIRIPNEKLINTELSNITRFPIRRLDIEITVSYREDIDRVKNLLLRIAKKNHYAFNEPDPLIIFKSFGLYGLEFLFCVWTEKNDYLSLKNSIMEQIKTAFDEEGITIPYPQTVIHPGSADMPFPLHMTGKKTETGEMKK